MRALTTIVVVAAGAWLLGWDSFFHLCVGVPVLALCALLLWWWKRRRRSDDQEEEPPEDKQEPPARRVLFGALTGLGFLLVLALVFKWWLPRCDEYRTDIRILEAAKAYERIVQIVDDRVRNPRVPPHCQCLLRQDKVRALLSWAEGLSPEDRIPKLEQAREEVPRCGTWELTALVEARLGCARTQLKIARLEYALREKDGQIQRQQETIQQQTRTIEQQRVQIGRLRGQIADLCKRLRELNVQPTPAPCAMPPDGGQ